MSTPTEELTSTIYKIFDFSNRISSGVTFSPGKYSKEKSFSSSFKPGVCQFSDTICFWTDVINDNINELPPREAAQTANLFFSLVSNFIFASLTESIPLRGGISYGETYINSSRSIFLGEPIIRAHKLEINQEWIGVAVDKRVTENLPYYGNWLSDYEVPFKKNNIDGLALNWTSAYSSPKHILKAFAVVNEALQFNHETKVTKKYENTKKFMVEMQKNSTIVTKENGVKKIIEMVK